MQSGPRTISVTLPAQKKRSDKALKPEKKLQVVPRKEAVITRKQQSPGKHATSALTSIWDEARFPL